MNFREWFASDENTARKLPDSSLIQVADYLRDAFKAGEAKSITELRKRGYTVTKETSNADA